MVAVVNILLPEFATQNLILAFPVTILPKTRIDVQINTTKRILSWIRVFTLLNPPLTAVVPLEDAPPKVEVATEELNFHLLSEELKSDDILWDGMTEEELTMVVHQL